MPGAHTGFEVGREEWLVTQRWQMALSTVSKDLDFVSWTDTKGLQKSVAGFKFSLD